MRMAKASEKDIQSVIEFFQAIEEFMEYGTSQDGEESVAIDDAQFVEKLRDMWGHMFGPAKVNGAWLRVVFGCANLIANCCDPSVDYLDWKPEIKAAVEAAKRA